MSKPDVNVRAEKRVTEIAPSIWWVGRGGWGDLPALTEQDCNVFLVRGDEFDVLVDIGAAPSLWQLERNIRAAGSEPARIGEIWITHSHFDHFGNAAKWVKRHPRTVVRLSAVGVDFLKRRDLRLTGTRMYPAYKFLAPRRLKGVKAGDVLRCPPFKFSVVELPGHTPDCVGFRGDVSGLDVMFTGDAIVGDQATVRGGVGWLDGLWLSDVKEYERMLMREAKHPPGLILPGHGVPSYGPAVGRSIRNCLWRIRKLLAIPALGSMLPIVR
ncbi:MAG: MBL fold metallo-hydrolase [Phycisphaerae bacterium]